jgi:hypothetical protein
MDGFKSKLYLQMKSEKTTIEKRDIRYYDTEYTSMLDVRKLIYKILGNCLVYRTMQTHSEHLNVLGVYGKKIKKNMFYSVFF